MLFLKHSNYIFMLLLLCCTVLAIQAAQEIDLSIYERCYGSAGGEDGVTEALLVMIGTTNKYYVEFGVGDGTQCNTRFLLNLGWRGLMMDRGYKDASINLQQEYVTAENINDLLAKYNVPHEFDVLSVDIDYNDFYVLYKLLQKYQPRVIIVEYNATHLPDEDKVVIYDPNKTWDGSNYFGASLRAFYNLGIKMGYTLVYAEKEGVNLFLVSSKELEKSNMVISHAGDCKAIYRPPKYGSGPNGGHAADPLNRAWVSSSFLLKA